MSNFPYETISDFFDAEGDFEENFDPERQAFEDAEAQAVDDAAAEAAYYEYVSDVEMGMYDDDPNPYHGDYSEM